MTDPATLHLLKQTSERVGMFCEKMAEQIGTIPAAPFETAEEYRSRICNMLKGLAAQFQAMADGDEEEIRRQEG
jgi:hypothetical protein